MYLSDWNFEKIAEDNPNFLYQNLPLLYGRNLLTVGILINLILYGFTIELNSKKSFIKYSKKVIDFKKSEEIFRNLVPEIAREKMIKGERGATIDYQVVTIIFCDISDFDKLMSKLKPREIISLLDKVYNTFDQLCGLHGLEKIETVGKTYMAAGGLEEWEKNLDPELKERHHAVRVFEMALDILDIMQSVTLEGGEKVKVKIGVHTGKVLAAVVGAHKPQFSLIGDTVNVTARMCGNSKDLCIMCSQYAYEHIKAVYNENFICSEKWIKGKGDMKLYLYESELATNGDNITLHKKETSGLMQRFRSHGKTLRTLKFRTGGSIPDERILETKKINKQKSGGSDNSNNIYEESGENNSSPTLGLSKQLTKRGFNLASDRQDSMKTEIKNDLFNKSFFFLYFKSQAVANLYYEYNQQFFNLNALTSSVLIYTFAAVVVFANYNTYYTRTEVEQISYFILTKIGLSLLMVGVKLFASYIQEKYHYVVRAIIYLLFIAHTCIIQFSVYYTNEFLFTNEMLEQKLVLICFAYNGIFEFYQIVYGVLFHATFFCVTWIIMSGEEFIAKYTVMLLLVSIGIICTKLYREYQSTFEYLKNKKANDDLTKNEDLLFNMMPPNVVQNLKEDIPVAEEIKNVTMLFSDIVGFTDYSSSREPKEVVEMVSELFRRFDNASNANNVYKVHTIGDCYVNLGYTGKVPERDRNFKEEAMNVIKMGRKMIEIIEQVREKVQFPDLNMRIGIHTVKT